MMLSLLLTALIAPPSTLGSDPRCGGGPGIQFWEDASLSGRTFGFCQNIFDGTSAYLRNLDNYGDNLFFWENWSDRITSFQTFNTGAGRRTCLYENPTYTGLKYTATGNVTVLNIGSSLNDKASSIKGNNSYC
jgi:hypothetical protein